MLHRAGGSNLWGQALGQRQAGHAQSPAEPGAEDEGQSQPVSVRRRRGFTSGSPEAEPRDPPLGLAGVSALFVAFFACSNRTEPDFLSSRVVPLQLPWTGAGDGLQ